MLAAARTHASSAQVQVGACSAIRSLTSSGLEALQGRVSVAEVIEVPLQALRAHSANILVKESACLALWSITLDAGSLATAVSAGAMECVSAVADDLVDRPMSDYADPHALVARLAAATAAQE